VALPLQGEGVRGTGQTLYAKARRIIPGGTQLLSKRPEMFLPEQWPSYYQTARGAEVTDLDGNTYTDMSFAGIGATILGFADPDVDAAVCRAVAAGSMATLNCPEEVELAELLLELHPWAEMARFGRAGGEALAIAIRIARAATRRDVVAFCGYHGWHDWYLSANLGAEDALDGHLLAGLSPAGVPRGLAGLMQPFNYNRPDELAAIACSQGDRLAAIIMEPVRGDAPAPGFLQAVRDIADRTGAVLVFDEVTSGFRLVCGGAHLAYGVAPDLAVFAKALGNGYPMAAIIGRGATMSVAQDTFISSTAWTERIGPVAALATLRKHRERNVAAHLIRIGEAVQRGWRDAAERAGLHIAVTGIAPLGHFELPYENGQAMRTLFTQRMLERGFLANASFYAMYAHQESDVARYLAATAEIFGELVEAHAAGEVEARLRGPVAHRGFQRLT
jgi:glutamate-1-semialdehyde 2,1-aminomutase